MEKNKEKSKNASSGNISINNEEVQETGGGAGENAQWRKNNDDTTSSFSSTTNEEEAEEEGVQQNDGFEYLEILSTSSSDSSSSSSSSQNGEREEKNEKASSSSSSFKRNDAEEILGTKRSSPTTKLQQQQNPPSSRLSSTIMVDVDDDDVDQQQQIEDIKMVPRSRRSDMQQPHQKKANYIDDIFIDAADDNLNDEFDQPQRLRQRVVGEKQKRYQAEATTATTTTTKISEKELRQRKRQRQELLRLSSRQTHDVYEKNWKHIARLEDEYRHTLPDKLLQEDQLPDNNDEFYDDGKKQNKKKISSIERYFRLVNISNWNPKPKEKSEEGNSPTMDEEGDLEEEEEEKTTKRRTRGQKIQEKKEKDILLPRSLFYCYSSWNDLVQIQKQTSKLMLQNAAAKAPGHSHHPGRSQEEKNTTSNGRPTTTSTTAASSSSQKLLNNSNHCTTPPLFSSPSSLQKSQNEEEVTTTTTTGFDAMKRAALAAHRRDEEGGNDENNDDDDDAIFRKLDFPVIGKKNVVSNSVAAAQATTTVTQKKMEEEGQGSKTGGPFSPPSIARQQQRGHPIGNKPKWVQERDEAQCVSIKLHQLDGIRFIWRRVVQGPSVNSVPATGCILAHSMGLGKSCQILTFLYLFFKHVKSNATAMIVLPKSTFSSWVNEIRLWEPYLEEEDEDNDEIANLQSPKGGGRRKNNNIPPPLHRSPWPNIKIFDDSMKSQNTKIANLKDWYQRGGLMLIGYESLVALHKEITKRKSPIKMGVFGGKNLSSSPLQKSNDAADEETKKEKGGNTNNTNVTVKKEKKKRGGDDNEFEEIICSSSSSENESEEGEGEEMDEDLEMLFNPEVSGVDVVICDEGHRLRGAGGGKGVDDMDIPDQEQEGNAPGSKKRGPKKKAAGKSLQIVETLAALAPKRRILLTGTPLQNHLMEYWAMINFVIPKYFSKKKFRDFFIRPIANAMDQDATRKDVTNAKNRQYALVQEMNKFVDRKDNFLLKAELPPMHEYVVVVPFTPLQAQLYETFLTCYEEAKIRGKGGGENEGNILQAFSYAGKICAHPALLYPKLLREMKRKKAVVGRKEEEEEDSAASSSVSISSDDDEIIVLDSSSSSENRNLQKKKKPERKKRENNKTKKERSKKEEKDEAEDIKGGALHPYADLLTPLPNYLPQLADSDKMSIAIDIVLASMEQHEKVVIFSMSTKILDLFEEMLSIVGEEKFNDKNYVEFVRIDGSVSGDRRNERIARFQESMQQKQKPQKDDQANAGPHVFLISTKAGGVGITLTAATRMIILDCSWNPADDRQAMGRIYRYGQTKTCYVYRLVCNQTIEHRVFEQKLAKEWLFHTIVDKKTLTRKDLRGTKLRDLFQRSATADEGANLSAHHQRMTKKCCEEDTCVLQRLHNRVFRVTHHDSLLEEDPNQYDDTQHRAYEKFLQSGGLWNRQNADGNDDDENGAKHILSREEQKLLSEMKAKTLEAAVDRISRNKYSTSDQQVLRVLAQRLERSSYYSASSSLPAEIERLQKQQVENGGFQIHPDEPYTLPIPPRFQLMPQQQRHTPVSIGDRLESSQQRPRQMIVQQRSSHPIRQNLGGVIPQRYHFREEGGAPQALSAASAAYLHRRSYDRTNSEKTTQTAAGGTKDQPMELDTSASENEVELLVSPSNKGAKEEEGNGGKKAKREERNRRNSSSEKNDDAGKQYLEEEIVIIED